MQTPAPLAGPPDLQVSEAATPGASVAAVRGEHDHVLETPEFDTPGQASPARHRSNEGGRSLTDGAQLDSSRSRSAGLHAAAAALAEVAASPAAAAAAAEPLSKPRLRVQGADIILEDAASPKDAAENGGGAAHRPPQEQPRPQQLAAGAAAAAGGAGASASAAAQQPAAPPTQQQQQQPQQPQQHVQPPPLNLAAMRVSQAHEHELQLRLASRTATGVSNMAIASTRPPATHPLPHGEDRCAGLANRPVGGRVWWLSGYTLDSLCSLHVWVLAKLVKAPTPCRCLSPTPPDTACLPPTPPLQPAARPRCRRRRRRGGPRQRRQRRGGGAGAHQVPLHPHRGECGIPEQAGPVRLAPRLHRPLLRCERAGGHLLASRRVRACGKGGPLKGSS